MGRRSYGAVAAEILLLCYFIIADTGVPGLPKYYVLPPNPKPRGRFPHPG